MQNSSADRSNGPACPDDLSRARFEGWQAAVEQCLALAQAYTEGHDAEAVVHELELLLERKAPLPPGIEAPHTRSPDLE